MALAHIVAILGMAGVVGRQCIAVNRANSFRRFMAGVGIIAMVAMMVLRRRCRAVPFWRPGANMRGPTKIAIANASAMATRTLRRSNPADFRRTGDTISITSRFIPTT